MTDDLLDVMASLDATKDQREAVFGDALGVGRQVPLDAVFLVSPDVGMRLTRDGKTPDRVRISWNLPPGTMYACSPDLFR